MYEVLQFVNQNLHQPLTLYETAERFGWSQWHFCERFREYTGVTFLEYVRTRRMQLAAADLLAGKKAGRVALCYGYQTSGGFTKAFLKEFGCLPHEYTGMKEKRRNSMFTLTDRCAILCENAVALRHDPRAIYQRHFYWAKGVFELPIEDRTPEARTTAGLTGALGNFLPLLGEGELLAGYNYAPLIPDVFSPADITRGELRQSGFSAEEAEWFLQHRQECFAPFSLPMPLEELTAAEQDMAADLAALGYLITFNHTVIGYEQVLRFGFAGFLEQVEKYRKESNAIYPAAAQIAKAAAGMGERYAAECERQAEQCGNPARQKELLRLAGVCRRVPRHPARNFYEAVQALWFAHIINTWEDGINANSLGRLDQILWPYYKADVEAGRITKEEAFELICCLFIKLYRDYDVQQSCVGGCDSKGKPAENELSYLMLEAAEALNFIRCLSVRFSPDSDPAFLRRALETVGRLQNGIPFFFNDAVLRPALEAKGISPEDAADYTQIGCVETVIPGKSNPHAVTARVNTLKALEYALGNGQSMFDPARKPGPATGDPLRFTRFDQLLGAVLSQLDALVMAACKMTKLSLPYGLLDPKPYKSLLTQGCLETGRDFNDQGAKYDYYQVMLLGLPNLADSLAALEELVFTQKRYTLGQVIDILKKDFESEAVRQEFLNRAPKYGNDIPAVDRFAALAMDRACDRLEEAGQLHGLSFHAQPFTFLWMLDHGATTAATPDGRRKGEILAYSLSPMQGRDFNGLTALLNSLTSLPTRRAPGTTSAIVEVEPQLFTERNIPRFTALLQAAANRGLCNVQFNVVTAELLQEAQAHPEKHQNLAVRVSGFSQRFTQLDKLVQDHIIHRTKHKYL